MFARGWRAAKRAQRNTWATCGCGGRSARPRARHLAFESRAPASKQRAGDSHRPQLLTALEELRNRTAAVPVARATAAPATTTRVLSVKGRPIGAQIRWHVKHRRLRSFETLNIARCRGVVRVMAARTLDAAVRYEQPCSLDGRNGVVLFRGRGYRSPTGWLRRPLPATPAARTAYSRQGMCGRVHIRAVTPSWQPRQSSDHPLSLH